MKPRGLGGVTYSQRRPRTFSFCWFQVFRWFPFLLVSWTTTTTPFSLGVRNSGSNSIGKNKKILDSTIDYSSDKFHPHKLLNVKDIPNSSKKNDNDDNNNNNNNNEEDEMNADQKFLERIQSSIKTVQNWDSDPELLKACRSQIPWEELRNINGIYSKPHEDRLLRVHDDAVFVQRLARWFQKFMSWVNTPPCKVCGCEECEMKTVRGPETEEEKEGHAKRVEVYYCPECDANTTTFPRYNRAQKLLETKQGRCGEYSNLFGLFCRSVGLETRLILDLSDHLWTEVRLGDSWIMVDSCEGIIDKASMYEDGWGKEGLCYMIAISSDHVVDVTPRYTRKYLTDEFQTRRREHTTSEEMSASILRKLNEKLQAGLSPPKLEELNRRKKLEVAELQLCKQAREWTEQEKYGRGRISGSLAWKESRHEAGRKNKEDSNEKNDNDDEKIPNSQQMAGFEVEAFCPPIPSNKTLSLRVKPNPTCHHDGIIVANTPCAVGESGTVSVVVVDEACFGCILQSRSFLTWQQVEDFIDRLPSHRIVIMNGYCKEEDTENERKSKEHASFNIPRLGGWIGDNVKTTGVLYMGQVDAHPDWTYCEPLFELDQVDKNETISNGEEHEVELEMPVDRPKLKLRTEKRILPHKIAGRLPETVMPFKTQLLATEEQKRLAFTSFCTGENSGGDGARYCGYTSKPNSPIYLLDSTSYPFSKMDTTNVEVLSKENAWNVFHYLPPALVPEDDQGVLTAAAPLAFPKYDVPLEDNFFNNSLGSFLLGQNNTRLPTSEALHNTRLVGLYFSAHWCGPCRSFTPMLAEMYDHLKEARPSHGLEIVFVSGDRDQHSFEQYFRTMPWQAIPFDTLQMVNQSLNMTYGVRGIPSFVVLDAVTGQVVVPANQSRQEVSMACRGGEQSIEAMLDSWLDRSPQETREILSMLEMSCLDDDIVEDNNKENPYLMREESKKETQSPDLAGEIKNFFEKLVAEGCDPTSAAAKAISMVAEEQKKGTKNLDSGPLDGRASHAGPPLAPVAGLDQAFASVMEWNSPSVVREVLSTAKKYLDNATKEPWAPKFRSFKLSNKVADKFARVEGGLGLLQSLGFEVFGTSLDFKACIPVSADLGKVNATISHLLKDLDDMK